MSQGAATEAARTGAMTVPNIKRIVFALGWLLMGVMFLDARLQARNAEPLTAQARTREGASFPHNKDKHRTLECSNCHRVTPVQPDVKDFPGHASCASCHNLALEALTKPVVFCAICHEGRPVSKTQAALFRFPKPQVKTDFGNDFSHPSHLKPLPAGIVTAQMREERTYALRTPGCTDCHKRTASARIGGPEMSIETGHRNCFQCHGEKPIKPPSMNQCAECHKIDGPHAPHLYGFVKAFKHEDHEFEIRRRKKRDYPISKAPDYLCSECHASVVKADALDRINLPEQRYCMECHSGRLGLPDPLGQAVLDDLSKR